VNYLLGLDSNLGPPDLCLLSSWDYRHEPPAVGTNIFIYMQFILCKCVSRWPYSCPYSMN
jgi:hypothetical protein